MKVFNIVNKKKDNILSYFLNYGENLDVSVNVEKYKTTSIVVELKPGATLNLTANFGENQPFGILMLYLNRYGGDNVDTVIINGIQVPFDARVVEMRNPDSISSYKYTLIDE